MVKKDCAICLISYWETLLRGPEKNNFNSRAARKALAQAMHYSGLVLKKFEKDFRGAPVPENGVFWSVSHKSSSAAAICSSFPSGIDVEIIRPRTESLMDYIASEDEWRIFDKKEWVSFYRIFTAKEAVLKIDGSGLVRLSECRVISAEGSDHLTVRLGDTEFNVWQYAVENLMLSVAGCSEKPDLSWIAVPGEKFYLESGI